MIIIVLTDEYLEISKHVDGIAHEVTGKPYLTHISVMNFNSYVAMHDATTFMAMEVVHHNDGKHIRFVSTNLTKTYNSISEFYEDADELYDAHKLVLLRKKLGIP